MNKGDLLFICFFISSIFIDQNSCVNKQILGLKKGRFFLIISAPDEALESGERDSEKEIKDHN